MTKVTLSPEVGTQLAATYKKEDYACEVVAGDNGAVLYQFQDGRTFKSLSAAGIGVTGRISCGGRTFWKAVGKDGALTALEQTAKRPRSKKEIALKDTEAVLILDEDPQSSAVLLTFKPTGKQTGVDEDMVKLYCEMCNRGFVVNEGENSTKCPKGHAPS